MTVMGEVLVKGLSDAGSIPARSIHAGSIHWYAPCCTLRLKGLSGRTCDRMTLLCVGCCKSVAVISSVYENDHNGRDLR